MEMTIVDEARVVSGEFFPNGEEGTGGGDAMNNELCHWGVQVDTGGARDQVKEGGSPRVQGCGLNRFHGD
jgi:hypothetical protein